ncbi:MAG: glycosyltransferase family 2 protein [Bacteroidales bacterium]|nr:glycosyltransferase family 2 protein [Bacteroidales bacterium]
MPSTLDIAIAAAINIDAQGLPTTTIDNIFSAEAMLDWLRGGTSAYVGMSSTTTSFSAIVDSIGFMVDCLEGQEASLVYADYVVLAQGGKHLKSLADAEEHVSRDSFDFGPLLVCRRADAIKALTPCPAHCTTSAFYALTLGLQRIGSLYHTGVPVGFVTENDNRDSGVKQFDYVNPINVNVQKEREAIFTAHLKAIGALSVEPEKRKPVKSHAQFARRASVIIPVRNRVDTVGDAVRSALSQHTSFDFNVIVVDNHSDDGTTDLLARMAAEDERVVHIVPTRQDLGIGGCWNEAVASSECGQYAVQLDSDDLYSSDNALQAMVKKFAEQPYALVVGSYKLVDFNLEDLPPGVIDHREWTDANGANNILRINGMGAPRAFNTEWLRRHPMPNVSYGEDYAAVLRATRQYLVGRVYDVVYLCRRWRGNSDAGLTDKAQAAHDAYKDKLRSDEIKARIAMNAKK